jgi:Cu-Zn family superoxide dismutase
MPNIHVRPSGALELEVLTAVTDMGSELFDGDCAALVIHEGADDYSSQPSGAAGPRIACGVVELQTE